MLSIARQILLHDKLRFIITVVSLGFAIVMVVYDLGMFLGVVNESVNLIDRAQAGLWVMEEECQDLSSPSLVPETVLKRARRFDGVAQACGLDILPGNLKIDDDHQVQIVGIDPDCPLIRPWDVVAGDLEALRRKDTIIVDDMALRRDPAQVGDVVELNGRELRLVAITHHNKGFSTPYVYTNSRTFGSIGGTPGHHSFVAIRTEPGADEEQLVQRLGNASSGINVLAAEEFRFSSIMALIAAGVGMIFTVVFVGVLVGMLIITLTVYTATMEQLRNFAILKALGATKGQARAIVLEQAIVVTLASFGVGLVASLGLNYFVETVSGIRAIFPIPAVMGSLLMMVALAIVGSLVSIRKALSADPAMVFRA